MSSAGFGWLVKTQDMTVKSPDAKGKESYRLTRDTWKKADDSRRQKKMTLFRRNGDKSKFKTVYRGADQN